MAQDIDELAAAASEAAVSLNALSGNLGAQKQKEALDALDAATGIKNFGAKLNVATTAVQGLGKIAGEYASAMYQGKKGMSAMNSTIDATTDAMVALGLALMAVSGPLGLIVGGLGLAGKAVGSYVKAVNEQTDALFKAYQSLSQAGAVGSEGLQGVYSDMQKLGLGIQDLDKMVSLLAGNAPNLALFGGTVREGRRKFADIGQAMDGYKVEMYNLGMSQDELNEGLMSYLRLQSRMGSIQNKSVNDVAEEARKYLLEQDAVTKLTGMTRKEQEDALDSIRSQEMFRGKLEELRAQGRDKEAAELEKAYKVIYATNKKAAQGFADISTGNLRTQAAQQEMRVTQGESMRVAKAISEGSADGIQGAQRVYKAHADTAKTMGTVLAQNGNYNRIMGDYVGDLTMSSKLASGSLEEIYDGIVADQARQKAGADAETDRRSKLEKSQQDQMKEAQNFVRAGKDATVITKGFSDALGKATTTLSRAVVGGGVGAAPPGYAAPPAPTGAAPGAAPAAPSAVPAAPGVSAAPQAMEQILNFTSGTGSKQNFMDLNSRVIDAVVKAATQYKSMTGNKLTVNSGKRDPDDQKRLWDESVAAGRPGRGPTGMLIASPDKPSAHTLGMAVDIQQGKGDSNAISALWSAGLKQLYGPQDPVHFEVVSAAEGGVFKGPKSGYPATLHGDELVAPLDNSSEFMQALNGLAAVSEQTLTALQEIARYQQDNLNVREKMLRATRN